jgi:hypothetical protein
MTRLLFIFVSVALLATMFSCSPSPERKVTGIVKEFVPEGKLFGDPEIVFTDKREFSINHMPDVQIEPGSEIAIYYITRAEDRITPDSIVIIKPAPKENVIQTNDIGSNNEYTIPLKDGDFEAMCNFIEKKGTSVAPHDKQFVFLDKDDNRHAMMTIHRADGNPKLKGDIIQITVWVNSRDVTKGKKFYYYIITRKAMTLSDGSDKEAVKNAVTEFLDVVK